ncbi:MAG: hypothetical protein EB078_06410 [Proteobacteria bacterium]|nr:hypothetical protein [Pseudomonadota bacterium]NDC24600.1 hypothetical protein [Pseudomonadota bacterium]NDD04519.1 hypothetical protein [Pseudomonadota bacterium]NDG25997.1 hypothetical protein [Pseudomonadota bacterium]
MFRHSLLFFLFSIFLVSNFGCGRKKLDTTRSPQINRDDPSWMIDPKATGSWNLNGTLWAGTAACTAGKATQFSAYVNLRDGSLDRPECMGGVSR